MKSKVEVVKGMNFERYFRGEKTIKIFSEQYNNFYNANIQQIKKYSIGDEVQLNKNSLIHGTRIPIDNLSKVKENGLIASEFYENETRAKKKPYIVEFWRVDENISLKQFIEKYCGVTIEVYSKEGQVIENIISPFKDIEENIKKVSKFENFRDYTIYQNQEQRFLPNRIIKQNPLAFIINNDSAEKNLILKNDIFSNEFDFEIIQEILPEWYIEQYIKNGLSDRNETRRERGIIYGVPSCFIEGIIVNEEIENCKQKLEHIVSIFPECYICNIDGKVLL